MTHIHNRAIGVPDPDQGNHRQADPARTSNRSAPPAPLPGPPSHPFAVRIQNMIASGKTKAEAMRAAVAADPSGHESWLAAVQRHGR